jgi:hypothetical protein
MRKANRPGDRGGRRQRRKIDGPLNGEGAEGSLEPAGSARNRVRFVNS